MSQRLWKTLLLGSAAVFATVLVSGLSLGSAGHALAASANITASCPNQQTVQSSIPAGAQVSITTSATSPDFSESFENEPLITSFNGVAVDVNNYNPNPQSVTFVAATPGNVTACINGYDFEETGTVTVTLTPTTLDSCKDGAWQVYGVFKNQGDCVSFVATHGTNPPAHP